jgi:hypothetical protein
MEDNIYIELELFLDPPIIDAAELETHLNEQIKNWNKQVNANPKLKLQVNKARDLIKAGLRNLSQQAKQARNQKLEELRKQIALYKRTGAVTEKNLKRLKNRFKKFFGERTIENEANGIDSSTVKLLPKFTPPQQPAWLKCNKIVSYVDMRNIADWLKHVKNGKHKNLYQLLGLQQSTSMATLRTKAESEANIINKMPKSNIEADFLNRLAQKFLLYFKNDAERASYDIALTRELFDKHCDDEFSLYAENFFDSEKTDWQIYTESITKTQSLGFSRMDAEWLVYEFYCIKSKCPEPVPEAIAEPPDTTVVQHTETYGQQTGKTEETDNLFRRLGSWVRQQTVKTETVDSHSESSVYSPPVESGSSSYTSSTSSRLVPSAPEQKFPYHIDEIRALLREKKVYKVYEMLWLYQFQLPKNYLKLWEQLKSQVAECDKQSKHITEAINKGKLVQAEKLILKLQQYMPDHVAIEVYRDEIQSITEITREIKRLTEKRRWIDAETTLRRFLYDHPNLKEYGLLTLVQQIEEGIRQINVSLSGRFTLATVFVSVCVLLFGIVWIADGDGINAKELFNVLSAIGIISSYAAIFTTIFYAVQRLGTLPATARKFYCRQLLGDSDFANPKLSETAWYTTIEKEWRKISQQQQQVRHQQSQRHPPPSQPIKRINVPKPS